MISIIIPVFNEAENLDILDAKLKDVFKNHPPEDIEFLYINDGSTDTSESILLTLSKTYPNTHLLSFSRNYGQTAALDAGFKAAKGDILITLDADLQNDPADIPMFLDKIEEGYDVVSGWRKNRKDPFFSKKIPSYLANLVIRVVTKAKIHDFGCTLKAYRKKYMKNVNLYGEMHRFIPVYAQWNGAKITEIVTTHHPRKHGQSKYGIGRTWKVLLDLLTIHFLGKYSVSPIYFFGKASFICMLSGTMTFSFVLYRRYFLGAGWISPMIFIGFFLFGLAIQCLFFGIIAEILSRIYYQNENKSPYYIKSFSRDA